jgi:hypothetical protein
MKKEITFLMDEKRNLYIKDNEGIEYDFWALGWGIPVSLMVKTKTEQMEEMDKRQKENENEKNERLERAKETFNESLRPWYKKIFK